MLSVPKSLEDVFNFRDPLNWICGLTSLGIVGFSQMLFTGGMMVNLGEIFGFRRIWGRREEGRAEIRVGVFGGGILWIVMIIMGLGKYVSLFPELS